MLRNIVLRGPLNLTAAICRCQLPSLSPPSSIFFFSSDSTVTQLTRLPSLLEGCDYKHWLVVMEAPKGYPLRDEIVNGYIKTLALALGCEEDAKKSIYSVSTKYYYAFGCKVPEDFAYKIRCNIPYQMSNGYCRILICVMVKVATEESHLLMGRLFHTTTSIIQTGYGTNTMINIRAYPVLGKPGESERKIKCN